MRSNRQMKEKKENNNNNKVIFVVNIWQVGKRMT